MVSTVNTKNFTYYKTDKKFVADISDLNLQFKQIYPDACDLGLGLVSARTGMVSEWAVCHTNMTSDEITSWILEPTNNSLKKFPRLKDHIMVIFND